MSETENKHTIEGKNQQSQKLVLWDFPGGPMVKNPPSNAVDVGSIPGQGTKIPQATGQLSLCALEPERRNQREARVHRNRRSCMPQQRPRVPQQRPDAAK